MCHYRPFGVKVCTRASADEKRSGFYARRRKKSNTVGMVKADIPMMLSRRSCTYARRHHDTALRYTSRVSIGARIHLPPFSISFLSSSRLACLRRAVVIMQVTRAARGYTLSA